MLNPTAPQFAPQLMSIFSRTQKSEEDKAKRAAEKAAEKEAKRAEKREEKKAKAEKSEKPSRKEKDKQPALEATGDAPGMVANSPVGPRRSRDNRSISTVDVSDASPRESLERSLSQTTTESQAVLGSLGKETFMQKLSRKSSSSQFLPFGKAKASLFSKKTSDVGTPDETEEESSIFLGSAGNSPSIGTPKDKVNALSWSSLKRMGKRGDKTPSLHDSITSDEDAEGHWGKA